MDDHKLLHLSSPSPLECLTKMTIHPQTPAQGALRRGQRCQRSSLMPVGPKCNRVVFYEGDIAGGLGLGLVPGLRMGQFDHLDLEEAASPYFHLITRSDDTCHLLPEEPQAMGHEEDKGKGQINNSKTETVLINSMEWQGRV